jgi:hypothetical protein
MRERIFMVVFFLTLAGAAGPVIADCAQLAPNPNRVGSTISNSSSNGCNESEVFENFGTLNNSGTLENTTEMRNFGRLVNNGTLNNLGELVNYQSTAGHIRNIGMLNNFGNVRGYGFTHNSGMLNNYGMFNTGDFGENFGVVNNYSGATLLSVQRYTNEGVVNNTPGGTIKTTVGWINNGTINNSGSLNYERSNFLNNNGVLNNKSGGTLIIGSELKNVGLLENDGELRNDRRINSLGHFRVSASGSVTGTGHYTQFSGETFVHGSLSQGAVDIVGGLLAGNGQIMSSVNLHAGSIDPGGSPGVLTIHGEYAQGALASLVVELGGEPSGLIGHDMLEISGKASLEGRLDVRLYDFGGGVYEPKPGEEFDILRADSITGRFREVSLPALASGLSLTLSYLTDAYGTTDVVRLSVTPAAQ